MAIEMLAEVAKAEKQAASIRENARISADKAKDEALHKTQMVKAESVAKIDSEISEKLKTAVAIAESEVQAANALISKQCVKIKADASVNMKKAVDIIIAKVVRMNG